MALSAISTFRRMLWSKTINNDKHRKKHHDNKSTSLPWIRVYSPGGGSSSMARTQRTDDSSEEEDGDDDEDGCLLMSCREDYSFSLPAMGSRRETPDRTEQENSNRAEAVSFLAAVSEIVKEMREQQQWTATPTTTPEGGEEEEEDDDNLALHIRAVSEVPLIMTMLDAQDIFRQACDPATMDLGYYYFTDSDTTTRPSCCEESENCNDDSGDMMLGSLGLLTRLERKAVDVPGSELCAGDEQRYCSPLYQERYGDGIYTSSHPHVFSSGAKVGLLVARLKGVTQNLTKDGCSHDKFTGSQGSIGSMRNTSSHHHQRVRNYNTTETGIANGNTQQELVVIRNSYQCVPLIQFPASMFQCEQGRNQQSVLDRMYKYHCKLQRLMDRFFNQEQQTAVPRFFVVSLDATMADPPKIHNQEASPEQQHHNGRQQAQQRALTKLERRGSRGRRALATAPPLPRLDASERLRYIAPEELHPNVADAYELLWEAPKTETGECPICLQSLCNKPSNKHCRMDNDDHCGNSDDGDAPATTGVPCCPYEPAVVALRVCGHEFHDECIRTALIKTSAACPVCRAWTTPEPVGSMPSGVMKICTTTSSSSTMASSCCHGGFEEDPGKNRGCIVISYEFPAGIQKIFHPQPGEPHNGTARMAFLPDDERGGLLLKRLKYGFLHGLTFSVGTTSTSDSGRGVDLAAGNYSIRWSRIRHNTSSRSSSSSEGGGPYPGSAFFLRCNVELDLLGVPAAKDLI